ncbi:MAG: hypothetical protein WD830_01545 [Chloroflexota bacterium]
MADRLRRERFEEQVATAVVGHEYRTQKAHRNVLPGEFVAGCPRSRGEGLYVVEPVVERYQLDEVA